MLREIKTNSYHYFLDEKGLFQGEYKSYHENGHMYVHTFHKDDNIHGEYKSYFRNGHMWEHVLYQNGVEHGEYKQYQRNGKLRHATFYYQGIDLKVDPDTLTEQDRVYIMMSGRLPIREKTV